MKIDEDKLTEGDFLGFAEDPISHKADGYYHWDETWSVQYGPYPNRRSAVQALIKYCEQLDE